MFNVFDKFTKGNPISKVAASWFNKVASFCNTFTVEVKGSGLKAEMRKPDDPSGTDPVKLILEIDSAGTGGGDVGLGDATPKQDSQSGSSGVAGVASREDHSHPRSDVYVWYEELYDVYEWIDALYGGLMSLNNDIGYAYQWLDILDGDMDNAFQWISYFNSNMATINSNINTLNNNMNILNSNISTLNFNHNWLYSYVMAMDSEFDIVWNTWMMPRTFYNYYGQPAYTTPMNLLTWLYANF